MLKSTNFSEAFWQKQHLLTDSRTLSAPAESLFFAIKGERHDGHQYILSLYEKGVRHFVVSELTDEFSTLPEAQFRLVDKPVKVLQELAAWHRKQFNYPVIGITGSNAKTIVKEWLFQLLEADKSVVKSPKSYNSQLGVPLSVWAMESNHEMAIFEAGISTTAEMDKLQKIIDPDYGIFTNIGSAHSEGFANEQQKINEKLQLFKKVKQLVLCADHTAIAAAAKAAKITTFSWGFGSSADVQVKQQNKVDDTTLFELTYKKQQLPLQLPFTTRASVENALHCVVTMLLLKYDITYIQQRINTLKAVPMRLELKRGQHNTLIIDDTYNNDLGGIVTALDFLAQQDVNRPRTVVLSDFTATANTQNNAYKRLPELLAQRGVSRFVGVGPELQKHQDHFTGIASAFFTSVEELLSELKTEKLFQNEIILVKGARVYAFERVVHLLAERTHGTRLEVNLEAMVHNLNVYKSLPQKPVKLMVMLKAFGYGSGTHEVAAMLQYQRINYFGVAFTDEGVELRQNGIHLPIMVMNAQPESWQKIVQYQLEPEVYGLHQLAELANFATQQQAEIGIHINIDTGMSRLGFTESQLPELLVALQRAPQLKVASVFSHLAAADEAQHAQFTRQQLEKFERLSAEVIKALPYPVLRHVLNSSGIVAYPEAQYDMVRLGIGLYGVDPTKNRQHHLQNISSLKTSIIQIRSVDAGQTVGYGRKGKLSGPGRIATLAIGYADGYGRGFSQGKGSVLINGKRAAVVGNVCMDMTMVDVTDIPEAQEGDDVLIFGEELPITELAETLGTIPYEVLTNVSSRVKRIYYTG